MSWVDPQLAPTPLETTEATWGDLAGLEAWTGQTFTTPEQQAQAQAALDSARQVIRDLTGQHLSGVTEDLLTMDWNGGGSVFLPELPVAVVHLVEARTDRAVPQDAPEAWEALDATDVEWSARTGELRLLRYGWGWATWDSRCWGGPGGHLANLRVTYDHGYDPVPPDLTHVLYGMATRSLGGAATGGVGVKQETLGSYSVSYDGGGSGAAAGLTSWEATVLERYRYPNPA